MADNANASPKKRRRGNKNLNKISFDTETVTKSEAEELLKNLEKSSLDDVPNTKQKKIKQLNKNKREEKSVTENSIENSDIKPKSRTRRSKRRNKNEQKVEIKNEEMATGNSSDDAKGKRKISEQDNDEEECGTENRAVKSEMSSDEKKESKRSIKRKRFIEMLQTKKKLSEDNLEKGCLEYLSNYKYNRDNWKFEKLKQIWIMDNLFNEDKIDNLSWEIVVDYFETSKGAVRKVLIDKALKIIEEGDLEEKKETEGEEKDETVEKVSQVTIDRARRLVQSLQE